MSTEFPETLRLQRGQSLRVEVDPGASLVVVEGRVCIASPPSWLGEQVVTVRTTLHEGEVYGPAPGGWIEVSALAPARLAGLPRPVRSMPELGPRVARLVELLTGRMGWR